jgi:hypothetical protein
LYSLDGDVLVFRNVDGQPQQLSLDTYINARTKSQTVLALLYTPRLNIATQIEVSFDFSKPMVESTLTINHFVGMEGDDLRDVLWVDGFILGFSAVLVVMLFADALGEFLFWRNHHGRGQPRNLQRRLWYMLCWALEVAFTICIFAYAAFHYHKMRRCASPFLNPRPLAGCNHLPHRESAWQLPSGSRPRAANQVWRCTVRAMGATRRPVRDQSEALLRRNEFH